MLFRFTGNHTGGRSSITVFGVIFHGQEPAEVTDADGIRRLSGHPEFETVNDRAALDQDVETITAELTAMPKKRGRPKKG